jgi:hypothetical protein
MGGGDLVLDYSLADPAHPCASMNLREVDEGELRYNCFAGDIIFKVGSADFSACWGWVTVLDFALCLRHVASALDGGATEERLDFTENEAEIIFTRSDSDVRIAATYTPDLAVVPFPAFVEGVNEFVRRVVRELERDYPDLATNAAAQAITKSPPGGAS